MSETQETGTLPPEIETTTQITPPEDDFTSETSPHAEKTGNGHKEQPTTESSDTKEGAEKAREEPAALPKPFTEEELEPYTLKGIKHIIKGHDYLERLGANNIYILIGNGILIYPIILGAECISPFASLIKPLLLASTKPLLLAFPSFLGNVFRMISSGNDSVLRAPEGKSRSDTELGTSMYPFVYRGQHYEDDQGVSLDPNDLILCVSPAILESDGETTNEQVELRGDILLYTLRQALLQIDRSPEVKSRFKAVAINIGDYEEHEVPKVIQSLREGTQVPRETLFRGKKVKTKNPDSAVLLMSIEDLREMLKSDNDILRECVEQLQSSMVQLYYDSLMSARTTEERIIAIRLFKEYVQRELNDEIEALHYGPEIRRANIPMQFVRERVDGFGMIQDSEQSLRHTYTRVGEVPTTKNVSVLLGTNQYSPSELIHLPSPQQRARALYVIHETLKSIDPEKLWSDQSEVRRDLLRRLKKYRVILDNPEVDTAITPKELLIDQLMIYARTFTVIAAFGLASGLASIVVGELGGSSYTSHGYGYKSSLDRLIRRIETHITIPRAHYESEVERMDFPSRTPESVVEWHMPYYNMNPGGYYITSTSHDFRDGSWYTNTEVEEDLGTSLSDGVSLVIHNRPGNIMWSPLHDSEIRMDEDIRHIKLSRPILRSITEPTVIKPPILDGTIIRSVAVVNSSKELVPCTAVRHTDGTVTVEIPPVRLGEDANAAIHVVLVRATERYTEIENESELMKRDRASGLRVAERYTAIDNESELMQDDRVSGTESVHGLGPVQGARGIALQGRAAEIVHQAHELVENFAGGPLRYSQSISIDVRNGHYYSFDPPGKERLNSARTPEEYANTVADIEGCTCSQCNTGAVLLDNASDNPSPTNIAFGYLCDVVVNPESRDSSYALASDARHAFGITRDGSIVDSTPYRQGNDKMTRDYFDKKGQGIDFFDKDQINVYMIAKLITGTLAGGAGLFAVRRMLERMSRISGKECIADFMRETVMKGTSRRDLIRAYNFFLWLSWGDPHATLDLDRAVTFETEEELLINLGENIHEDRIRDFILHPTEIMKKAHLTQKQRIKMQTIAAFLPFLA